MFFIDNDSARHALIAGYSPILASAALIAEVWTHLAALGSHAWFARVPSASNIAAGPSRLSFSCMSAFAGARHVEPSFAKARGPALWDRLDARLSSGSNGSMSQVV